MRRPGQGVAHANGTLVGRLGAERERESGEAGGGGENKTVPTWLMKTARIREGFISMRCPQIYVENLPVRQKNVSSPPNALAGRSRHSAASVDSCVPFCSNSVCIRVCVCLLPSRPPISLSRAGHFRYFLIFSIIKKYFFLPFLYLFMHQSYLKQPTPSQINLIRNAKDHFYCWRNFKNTESAQLCGFFYPPPPPPPLDARLLDGADTHGPREQAIISVAGLLRAGAAEKKEEEEGGRKEEEEEELWAARGRCTGSSSPRAYSRTNVYYSIKTAAWLMMAPFYPASGWPIGRSPSPLPPPFLSLSSSLRPFFGGGKFW